MKIEEVDLVTLTQLTVPDDGEKTLEIEQKILKALKFRLLPDTLNFWLQSSINSWDQFMTIQPVALPLYFKIDMSFNETD